MRRHAHRGASSVAANHEASDLQVDRVKVSVPGRPLHHDLNVSSYRQRPSRAETNSGCTHIERQSRPRARRFAPARNCVVQRKAKNITVVSSSFASDTVHVVISSPLPRGLQSEPSRVEEDILICTITGNLGAKPPSTVTSEAQVPSRTFCMVRMSRFGPATGNPDQYGTVPCLSATMKIPHHYGPALPQHAFAAS